MTTPTRALGGAKLSSFCVAQSASPLAVVLRSTSGSERKIALPLASLMKSTAPDFGFGFGTAIGSAPCPDVWSV